MENKKTVLVRGYLNRNLGDDLFFKILFERYPNVYFVVSGHSVVLDFVDKLHACNVIKKVNKLNFVERVISRFFDTNYPKTKFLKNIISPKISYDAVVIIGGSLFQNFKKGVGRFFIDEGEVIYDKLGVEVPRFILGSNFGPFVENDFYIKGKSFFEATTDVCFRDRYSKELFADLKHIRYAPDVVFNLAYEPIKKIPNSIGISLIHLSETLRPHLFSYQKDYLQSITDIVIQAAKDNRTIRLFSFCKSEGDDIAILQVMNSIPQELHAQITPIFYEDDISEFLFSFQEMDIMICSRFHSMILGLVFQQKIFPIVYGEKMKHVLEDVGYKNEFIPIEDSSFLTYERVINNASKSVTDVAYIKDMAREQFRELDRLLLK